MLGRFLEVSIHAPDVAASIAFYESLGFVQLPVGDTWPHAYGVVTDGRLYLGLHACEFDSPALSFVHPGLAAHAPALRALGIEFAFAKLGEESFNELGFVDPSRQMVAILEARSFSPPDRQLMGGSALGQFLEFGIATRAASASRKFWESLGFVAFRPQEGPLRRTALAGPGLDIGLYEADLAPSVLSFADGDPGARQARLERLGLRCAADALPRSLRGGEATMLTAPEGTRLLLIADPGTEQGEAIEVEEHREG